MSIRRQLRQRLFRILLLAEMAALPATLKAADFNWDADPGTPGIQAGAAIWASNTWWDPITGSGATFGSGDTAWFGGASSGSIGGTVTLNSNQTASGLVFGRSVTTPYSLVSDGSPRVLTVGAGGLRAYAGALSSTTIGDSNLSMLLSANQSWSSFNGATSALTVNGAVDLGGNVLSIDRGHFTFANTISNGSLRLRSGVSGGGSGVTLTAANTFTGGVTFDRSTTMNLSGNGSLAGGPITLNRGTIFLDNSVTNNTDRLANSSAVAVNGSSRIHFLGNQTGSFSETIGATTLNAGNLLVGSLQAAAGQTSTLTFSSLTRSSGSLATATFVGQGLGTNAQNRIMITGQAAGDIGPWAIHQTSADPSAFVNTTFAAYDSTNGVIAGTTTVLGATSNNAATNFKYTANTNLTVTAANPHYKTLVLAPNGGRTISSSVAGNTAYIVSGGLAVSNTTTNGATTLSITNLRTGSSGGTGAAIPLYVIVGDPEIITASGSSTTATAQRTLILNSIVQDNPTYTGGLTLVKAGNGFLNSNADHTYTGPTVVNEGPININGAVTAFNGGAAGRLGASTSDASNLVLNGGLVLFNGTTAGTAVTDRLFTLGPGGGVIGNTGNTASVGVSWTNTGNIAVIGTGDRTLELRSNGATGFLNFQPNIIDGAGAVGVFASFNNAASVINLTSANSNYSGGNAINGNGTLRVTEIGGSGSVTGLGTGVWELRPASTPKVDFQHPVAGTDTTFTGSFNVGDQNITFQSSNPTGAGSVSSTATFGELTVGTATVATTNTGTVNVAANTVNSLATGNVTMIGNPTLAVGNTNGSAIGKFTLGALNDTGFARTITKTGAGTLVFGSNATAMQGAGVVDITADGAELGAANPLGNYAVRVGSAGSATLGLNANSTISGNITLGGTGTPVGTISTGANTLTITGALANNAGSTVTQIINGNLSLGNGTRTFNIDSGATGSDVTINAAISNGSINKTGLGILTLTGANALGAGSNVNVSAGTLIAGSNLGSNTLTVGATGSFQMLNSTAQTLTLAGVSNALTLNAGGRLGFELGAPGTNDLIDILAGGSALTTSGSFTLDFYNLGGLAAGTYNLLTARAV
jgi:fibronectin-binding autotransporter adhesin